MGRLRKIFCYLFIGIGLLLPNSVFAIKNSLIVNGEDLYVDSGINSMFDDTVIYDASTNTLTLDNYNGGVILSDTNDKLTVVLNGTNVITGDGEEEIGIESYNDLFFTGGGSIEINDVLDGIVSDDKLEVGNVSLNINSLRDGINVDTNDIKIDGSILINSDENGIYVDGGDVTLNGNVKIDSEGNGLYVYGSLLIDGGIVRVDAVNEGVFSDIFVMNDGVLYVTSLSGGIGTNTSIDINGGYLNSKVSVGGYAIAVLGSEDIEFNIGENMVIFPEGNSVQKDSIEIFDDVMYGLSLGEDGASIGIDFENSTILLDKIANEVIIKDSNSQYGKIINEVPENIDIVSSNLDQIIPLTDEERILYENGFDLSIILSMNDAVSLTDENLIKENIGDNKLIKSFDMSIFKKIGGLETQIYDLNSPIMLNIKLDEEFINKDSSKNRVYKVLRVHDGNVSVIDASFDASTGYLSFGTDKFSSYAIVYSDMISNPNTYDNVSLYFSVFCLSLVGFTLTSLYLKRRNA